MSRGYKQITGKDGRPFVKGDKRINRRGRPPVLPNLEMLLAKTLGAEINNVTAMERILIALIVKAQKGDARSAELLINRGYGLLTTKQDLNLNFQQWPEDMRMSIINELLNTKQ